MARRAIATGWVNVRADLDELRQDFDAARAETIKSTNRMQATANKTSRSFRAMWAAWAAGAAVVAIGASKAIKAASDLQETTNKFNVVFRGQQRLAESWTETLVEGFAMSTREAKASLASMQDLFVPLGIAADEAAS